MKISNVQGSQRGIAIHAVVRPGLKDPRMQNIAVLSRIGSRNLIPGFDFRPL